MKIIKNSIVLATLFLASSVHSNPNILLIIADDMGLDASRCYEVGNQQANMPVLEAMCSKGRVFDNAYAAPTCSPTRASIMTGKHGFRLGVGGAIPKNGDSKGVSSDELSLFDVLNKSDYNSALIGKWHIAGSNDGLNHPSTLGVKEYFGLYSGGVPDYSSWDAVHNGKKVKIENYSTTELTDRAIDWIGDQSKPWFLWLAYNAPHTPFHLPPQNLHTAGVLPDDKDSIKENPLPYYNAMLEALDTEMGRLLDSMSEEVRNNTIIMFLGDNGSPTPIGRPIYGNRRNKGSIFEGGTHVPFVVSGPGIEAGRTKTLMNTSDLFTTVSSLAGVPNQATDSVDFSQELFVENKVEKEDQRAREFAYAEHFGNNKKPPDVFGWAIRDERYKLVAEEGKDLVMFDLSKDPLEQNNLLAGPIDDEIAAQRKTLQDTYDDLREKL